MKLVMSSASVLWVAALGGCLLAGCLGDLKIAPDGDGGNGGGGENGAGGSNGVGGAMVCTPATTKDCNTGQPGICAAGQAMCNADGKGFGACASIQAPTYDNCHTPDDEDCDGKAIAQCTGALEGAFTPSGAPAGTNDDVLIGIATRPDGTFAVAGVVDGDVTTGPLVNAGQLYVAVINANSNLSWQVKSTGSLAAAARAVAVDASGNVIVAGDFTSGMNINGQSFNSIGNKDVVVAKFTSDGTLSWAKTFGGNALETGNAVTVDAMGNVYASGRVSGTTADVGNGPVVPNGEDVFLVSYSPTGALRWGRVFINPGSQVGRGLAATPDGDVILAGESTGNVVFDGSNHPNGGGTDCFIAKVKGATGNVVWSRSSATAGDQFGRAVAVLPNGNVLFTGRFENKLDLGGGVMDSVTTFDGFLVELNGASGAVSRQIRAGQAGTTYNQALAVDGAGDVIVAGGFEGITAWGGLGANAIDLEDASVVKLDGNTWAPVWLETFGGTGDQFAFGVAAGKDAVMLAGYFQTLINLGAPIGTVNTTGGDDMFVARLSP